MSTRRMVAWIDDNPDRKRTAENIGAEFINVRGQDPAVAVEKLLNGTPRRLVILDHILDKTSSTNPVFRRGSTIAEAIKEKWPACPVIGVTNADNVKAIDFRTKQTYDDLFSFVDFRDFIDRIKPIARDFARISDATLKRSTDLLGLLRLPSEDKERLEAALPDDLKRFLRDASVGSRLYRWVNHLMQRPGFLLDDLWTATFLGLDEHGFSKVRKTFDRAMYRGVFARQNDVRWWASRLAELLYRQGEAQSGEMSWHVGRRLRGITRADYSQCIRCDDESPPEVVAYLDALSEKRHAMHLKCTVLHPRYKRELYFEDIRMMRGL